MINLRKECSLPKVSEESELDLKKENAKESIKKKKYSWLTEKDRTKWKEEWKKKTEEAISFTNKMSEAQRNIKKHNEEIQRIMQEKMEKEDMKKQKEEMEEKKINEDRRKEIIEKKLKEFTEKREKRNDIIKFAKNSPRKKEYLYEKMNDKYMKNIEIPELEKRKKTIADRRNIYKSVKLEDCKLLNQSLDEALKNHEEKLKKNFEDYKNSEREYMKKANNIYKSTIMEAVIKEDQEERERQKMLILIPKEGYRKKMEYGQIVNYNYRPRVNPIKTSMEKEQSTKRSYLHKRSSLIKTLPTYKLKRKTKSVDVSATGISDSVNEIIKEDSKENLKKTINQNQNISKLKKVNSKIDYLKIMKKNLKMKPSNRYNSFLKDRTIPRDVKSELLKAQLEVVEEKVMLKEQYLRMNKNVNNLKVEEEISDMYIEAIKAKFKLIDLNSEEKK